MYKTRKNRSKKNFLKKIERTGKNAIPVVETGLKTVGNTAKVVAVKAAPVVEKGISSVYDTMVTGFDLGVKGVKQFSSKKSRSKRTKRRRHR
jgi:hypothetical protein